MQITQNLKPAEVESYTLTLSPAEAELVAFAVSILWTNNGDLYPLLLGLHDNAPDELVAALNKFEASYSAVQITLR